MSVTNYVDKIRILLLTFGAILPSAAWGQSCTFSVSAMNVGQIDTLAGSQTDSTATMNVNCTGTPSRRILICPNLGTGSGGATASGRQMVSGASSLNYQLFSDPARSVVWGSYSWAYPARAPALALTLGANGSASGSAVIYGSIFRGQTGVRPGTYLSSFSGSHVEFRYRYTEGASNCNSGAGTLARPDFNATAAVVANCLVSTQTVDFGSSGILARNVDATGQVSVTCTPSSAYSVGLNNGQTGNSPTNRRMARGTQAVTYGLYRDAARSQPWGNAIGSNTHAGTGAGTAQNFTVFGRVPPQSTPSPGTYTDTVVVTVTY